MAYLLHLDESGDPSIGAKPLPEWDFFVLGGVCCRERDARKTERRLVDFKQNQFPPQLQSKVIHANQLNNAGKWPELGLTPDEGQALLKKCYNLLNGLPLEAFPFIIDKVELRRQYTSPHDPHLLAYKFALERLQTLIDKRAEPDNDYGFVNIAYRSNIANRVPELHRNLLREGTRFVQKFPNIMPNPYISQKPSTPFFECADLVCYAVHDAYHQWLAQMIRGRPITELYLERIPEIFKTKFGRHVFADQFHMKIFPRHRQVEASGMARAIESTGVLQTDATQWH